MKIKGKLLKGAIKTIDDSYQNFKTAIAEDGKRYLEGYFSTKDPDRGGDISLPSAFTKTMKKFVKNPIVTYMHDWSNPIGKVIDYKIDKKGVWVKVEIAKGVKAIDDLWTLMEQGIIKAFSYGYRVIDSELIEKSGAKFKELKEVDVIEVAVVTIPMNSESLFQISEKGVKSIALKDNIETPENGNSFIHEIKFDNKEFTIGAAFDHINEMKLADNVINMTSEDDEFTFELKSGTSINNWSDESRSGITIVVDQEEKNEKSEQKFEEKTELKEEKTELKEEKSEETKKELEVKGALGDELAEQERRTKSDLYNIFWKTAGLLIKVNLGEKSAEKTIKNILDEFNNIAKGVAKDFIEINQAYLEECGISIKDFSIEHLIKGIEIESKVGQVLSNKNKALIENCVKSLSDSNYMLKSLLGNMEEEEPKGEDENKIKKKGEIEPTKEDKEFIDNVNNLSKTVKELANNLK